MKIGDSVKTGSGAEAKTGKIVRFYANHGTVLVKMESGKLSYFMYESLEKK